MNSRYPHPVYAPPGGLPIGGESQVLELFPVGMAPKLPDMAKLRLVREKLQKELENEKK